MLGIALGICEHPPIKFLGLLIATCVLLYGFFLSRMLGAGDIKLMAVCVGHLGIWKGGCVIFSGLVLALLVSCIQEKVWDSGWIPMKNRELKLAPYLLAGYWLVTGLF